MPRFKNMLAMGATLAAIGSAPAMAESNHKPKINVSPGQRAGELAVIHYNGMVGEPFEDGVAEVYPNRVDSSAYTWTADDPRFGWDYWTSLKCVGGNTFSFKRNYYSNNPETYQPGEPRPLAVKDNNSEVCIQGKLTHSYIEFVVERIFLENPPKDV